MREPISLDQAEYKSALAASLFETMRFQSFHHWKTCVFPTPFPFESLPSPIKKSSHYISTLYADF